MSLLDIIHWTCMQNMATNKYGMKQSLLFVVQKFILQCANIKLFPFVGLIILSYFNLNVIFNYMFSQNPNVCNPHYYCYGGKC